jgi:hypothetical protein
LTVHAKVSRGPPAQERPQVPLAQSAFVVHGFGTQLPLGHSLLAVQIAPLFVPPTHT